MDHHESRGASRPMSGRCMATRFLEPIAHKMAATTTTVACARNDDMTRDGRVRSSNCSLSAISSNSSSSANAAAKPTPASAGSCSRSSSTSWGKMPPSSVETLAQQRSQRSGAGERLRRSAIGAAPRRRGLATLAARDVAGEPDGGASRASARNPAIAPARSVSPPMREMPVSNTIEHKQRGKRPGLERRLQPVATTRSWWRRWRSRRLARRVPSAA